MGRNIFKEILLLQSYYNDHNGFWTIRNSALIATCIEMYYFVDTITADVLKSIKKATIQIIKRV